MAEFLPSDQTHYHNRDRLLPSQPLMRQFFPDSYSNKLMFEYNLERVINSVLPIKSVHEKFDIQLKPGMTYETLGSDLSTLHFLQLLVRLTGAKRVLEIGTYIGVSTMFLAEAVGDNGHVTSVEQGPEFFDIAYANIQRNSMSSRISLINCQAAGIVFKPDYHYDFIFLDGAKDDYGRLLPRLLRQLRPGGLLVIDDVFCQGDTLNLEPTTDKGRGVRNMLDQVAKLQDHSPVILPY